MRPELGPAYTKGGAYRARAESRQREYRASVLGAKHGRYGHLLSAGAAEIGKNFVLEEAFDAARTRREEGKGVAQRTFDNMLSSQAMCFNVFAPLSRRLDLAARVLRPFIEGLHDVKRIGIEHTPNNEIFGDQSGRGGVDCDVVVEGTSEDGRSLVLVIETKFVEPDFSSCGFRESRRRREQGLDVCETAVRVREDRSQCLYVGKKRYRYWLRSDEFRVLADGAVPAEGCPFSGEYWQLWVNLVLAHAEASASGAGEAALAVCASSRNTALLNDGGVLRGFRDLLRRPDSVRLIDLELLLARIAEEASPELTPWAAGLSARYGAI